MLTSVGGNDLVDWDDSGNLVCDGISTFSYNYDNKMLNAYGIDEPNVFVAIGYDCANNRVYRVSRDVDSNYTVRKYLLDYSGGLPKVLVELELDGSGGWDIVAQNYHYGDRLVTSIDSSGNSRFYVHDRNGNVRNVINSSGSVLNSYTYTPYGEDIAAQCVETVDNNWKFTGQYHDKEIDQYYLRARMYSPYLSRFNGYDPVYGGYTEPLTLHQYLYCLNDPVNRVDLSGEFSVADQNATHGIGNMVNYASGAYDAAGMVKDYATMVINGASLSNIFVSMAIDVAMDKAGGKFFEQFANAGSSIMKKVMAKGKYGEDLAGIVGKKVQIDSLTKTAKYRIPDELTDTTLKEVKNVKYQSLTSQLTDFLLYSKQEGLDFVLSVRRNTKISKSLKELEKLGDVTIEYFD